MTPDPDRPPDHPPGFEPPTDVHVPWYAWVLWPLGLLTALFLVMLVFRGCTQAIS